MKNKTLVMEERNRNKALDWLELTEQEDDFLLGRIPQDFKDTWEDEE